MNSSQHSKTVLITGGNGFLGQYVAAECKRRGYEVICIGRSNNPGREKWDRFVRGSTESISLKQVLGDIKLSYCFHFASSSHVPMSMQYPLEDFMSSVPGSANLLLYLAKEQPDCHCIVASSAAVYGNPASLPIVESSPTIPVSPYGVHKKIVEHLAEEYSRLYGTRITVMRIFSAFGNGLSKQLLWDLANKVFSAITKKEKSIELFGTGGETRDFIHAREVAHATSLLSQRKDGSRFDVYNVANGHEISVLEVAERMVRASGHNLKVTFSGEARLGDPMRWRADCTKLIGTGYVPSLHFDNQVREYLDWAFGAIKVCVASK